MKRALRWALRVAAIACACICAALVLALITQTAKTDGITGAESGEPATDAGPPPAMRAAAKSALLALRASRQAAAEGRVIALACEIEQGETLAALNERDAREQYVSPGSLFKVPSLLYLLASGIIKPEYAYTCTGRFYPHGESPSRDELIHEDVREPLPGQWYKCSTIKGHGTLSPSAAIAHSCNLFFLSLSGQLAGDAAAFADFCERYGLLRAARRIRDTGAGFCTRDRLHLAIGLPVRASVQEVARFFSLLLGDAPPTSMSSSTPSNLPRLHIAREIIMEGMREASRTGTARALRLPALLAKTGSGLIEGDIFKMNGWCVSAWPQDAPRILFVCFAHESYGAGLPLECSREFWRNFAYRR